MHRILYPLLICALLVSDVAGQELRLVHFTLETAAGEEYTQEYRKDRILVMFGTDRTGSAYSREWVHILRDTLTHWNVMDSVAFVGLADLQGVPFFLRGLVRSLIPDDRTDPLLLDWEGLFPEIYRFEDGACNILIFDRERKLYHRESVKVLDPVALSSLLSTLRTLITGG